MSTDPAALPPASPPPGRTTDEAGRDRSCAEYACGSIRCETYGCQEQPRVESDPQRPLSLTEVRDVRDYLRRARDLGHRDVRLPVGTVERLLACVGGVE